MLRSWLQVIAWWWSQDTIYLDPLLDTSLWHAAMQAPRKDPIVQAATVDPFIEFVVKLHAEKHAVYGTSWKRRGESISILANIARKVDRLGVAGAGDTAADTVIDLLVYLCLYRLWMTDEGRALSPVGPAKPGVFLADQDSAVEELLRSIQDTVREIQTDVLLRILVRDFEVLEAAGTKSRVTVVDSMIVRAAAVARRLWVAEQPASEGANMDSWLANNKVRFWRGYGDA